MIFFRTSLIVILVSISQILISADEELVVTGSYLKDRTLESSPVDIFNAVELENLNISSRRNWQIYSYRFRVSFSK